MIRAIIQLDGGPGIAGLPEEDDMKSWHIFLLILTVFLTSLLAAAQKPASEPVPKYDKSTEAVFKGTVEEIRNRQCPVTGGMGSHLILRQNDGSLIEVHLALTKFIRQYDLVFQQGDVLEVTGVKVKFEGVDTIFARKIKRGGDEFLFRDNDGKPLW
jgi:DNA/RNA endonuclease YhcR with UshA esterase domain